MCLCEGVTMVKCRQWTRGQLPAEHAWLWSGAGRARMACLFYVDEPLLRQHPVLVQLIVNIAFVCSRLANECM